MNLRETGFLYGLIPLLFLLIYFPVFSADYAYLDEIHQLWHNDDRSNFAMFLTQGRWLTGLLFQKLFASIHTIAQLKGLRLFSLAGWMVTALVWTAILQTWVRLLGFPKAVWWLGAVYVVCSIPVVVYIGWASCFEVFLAVLAGLLSGHFLYTHLHRQQARPGHFFYIALFGALLLGLGSLFIYQTAFGAFLLPFFLHYVQRRLPKPDKIVITGVVFYIAVHVLYYFLFKYSLNAYGMQASTRTALQVAVLKKAAFFFSGPLPQGFSLNLLYSSKSVFSLVFYPAMILVWVISVFRRMRNTSIAAKLLFIAGVLLLLALIYLPVMIAAENFASYRTAFAFNLAVFLMVMEALLSWISNSKKRVVFTAVVCVALLGTGIYTYQFQFVMPLKQEYGVLKKFMQTHYTDRITQVHFIRAGKYLFEPRYRTTVYRDELGVPSTYRNWVPEPLVKQLVLEQTGNRKQAEAVQVQQYENEPLFQQAKPTGGSTALLINMNRLFQAP